jgi:hypothetical protein
VIAPKIASGFNGAWPDALILVVALAILVIYAPLAVIGDLLGVYTHRGMLR